MPYNDSDSEYKDEQTLAATSVNRVGGGGWRLQQFPRDTLSDEVFSWI